MPRIGDAHPDKPDWVFASISGGALMYKGPRGEVMSREALADKAEPGDDMPEGFGDEVEDENEEE